MIFKNILKYIYWTLRSTKRILKHENFCFSYRIVSTEPIFAQEINGNNWSSHEWRASDQPTYICGPIRIVIISIRRVCFEYCKHYYYLTEEKLIYFCIKNLKNSHSYNRGTDELLHYFTVEFWGRILSEDIFNAIQILIAAIHEISIISIKATIIAETVAQ
jgi:hypothetical protein